ncbi:RNA-directed DNA polymerase from mobile element jockey [Octopus vulgaris]|uniref:RNA-directed DNA polymerase from mobile element jockey n=1 Tax=Octopus vulgaris TaxID=6645 RepID=A0AA36B139_OCTVU|nr:RNA-directed DNA polymerase from mobile element jockey [Octopus vulgaris]
MRQLERGWNAFDLTIYTDGSAFDGNATGGGGVIVTTGHPSDPQIHRSFAIPTGKWCSSFQSELKATKKALQEVLTEEGVSRVRIVSDSLSTLQKIKAAHPSLPTKTEDECEILILLLNLSDNGCQITFAWRPRHCGIPGNDLADEKAKAGTEWDQSTAHHHYDAVKAAIHRALKPPPFKHERVKKIYGNHGDEASSAADSSLTRQQQGKLFY